MKTNYIIAALAVVALASCSKSEIVDQNPTAKDHEISFTNYVGATTRATSLDLAGLKAADKGFVVYASQTNGSTTTYNFMSNQAVTWDASAWTYSPKKIWPSDESNKLSFYAYAPQGGDGIGDVTFDADSKSYPYTVNSTVATQTDLLWAEPQTGKTYSNLGDDKKVPFTFHHALSRIGFTAKTAIDYSSIATVTIQKIEFIGQPNVTGTVNLAATQASEVWSGVSGPKTGVDASDITFTPELTATNVTVTTTAAQVNKPSDYIMVIPTAAKNYMVKVSYTVTMGNDDNAVVTKNVIEKNMFSDATALVIGKAYSVNLNINLNTIEFTVTSVDEWGDETAIPVAIPESNS